MLCKFELKYSKSSSKSNLISKSEIRDSLKILNHHRGEAHASALFLSKCAKSFVSVVQKMTII